LTNGTIASSRIPFNIGDRDGDYTGELAGDTIRIQVKNSGGETGRRTLTFVLSRMTR
jgi:hypothetical protein